MDFEVRNHGRPGYSLFIQPFMMAGGRSHGIEDGQIGGYGGSRVSLPLPDAETPELTSERDRAQAKKIVCRQSDHAIYPVPLLTFYETVQALKNGQQELQARLNSTQNDEREARRNLSTAGEEMAAMREKHRDEVDELERKLSKKERERKELEDDCRDLKNELESSKGEVRDLKVRGTS